MSGFWELRVPTLEVGAKSFSLYYDRSELEWRIISDLSSWALTSDVWLIYIIKTRALAMGT